MARSERQEDGTRSGVGTLTKSGARPRPQQAAAPAAAGPAPRRGRPVPPQRPAGDQQTAGDQRPGPGTRIAGRRDERTASPGAAPAPPRPGLRRRAGVPPQAPPAERAAGPRPGIRTTGPQPGIRTTGPQLRVRTTGPQPALAPSPAQAPQSRPRTAAAGTAAAPGGTHRMPFVLLLCGLLSGALVSALVITTTLAEGSFQISNLQSSTSSLAKQQQALADAVAQAQAPQQIAQRASALGMRRVRELRFIDLTTGKVTNDGPTWSGALNAPGYAP